MKKIIAFACVFILVPLFVFMGPPKNKYFEISKNLEVFTSLYRQLNAEYVDELDPSNLMRIAIDAMLVSLDPYTNYISESQIEAYRFRTEGKYDGLGAQTKVVDGYLTIIDMYETSPAKNAGLKIGDQIISVDGNATEGKTEAEMKALLQGAPGSEFKVDVRRQGVNKNMGFNIVRNEVKVTNVPHSGFVSPDVGYVILTTFTGDASQNISKAIRDLRKENPNMKGLVFDLRSNGGGLLREAINVSNLFIDKNMEVVTTRGKVKERSRTYKTLSNPVAPDIPLVVLTNKTSASASEIVAGVIQDYDRGVILGQRSYGKGLVQGTKDIGYNSRLKVTTAKYYVPSGRCIQSVDYEDGEPKDISDSLRTQFKTRNGRLVLDGGGISPDVETELKKASPVVQQLNKQNLIFKFVNEWSLGRDSIDNYLSFDFNDFDAFDQFANKQGFAYESKAKSQVEELISLLESDYEKSLVEEGSTLMSHVAMDDKNALSEAKDEVLLAIQQEITKRYYSEKEEILYKLQQDQEVQKAISILVDTEQYSDLLK